MEDVNMATGNVLWYFWKWAISGFVIMVMKNRQLMRLLIFINEDAVQVFIVDIMNIEDPWDCAAHLVNWNWWDIKVVIIQK